MRKNNLKAKPFNLDDSQNRWVEETLSSLTTEEKIGQLFSLVTYTDDIDVSLRRYIMLAGLCAGRWT